MIIESYALLKEINHVGAECLPEIKYSEPGFKWN